MSRNKQKGTAAETAVVNFLRDHGFPAAERRALHGNVDLGDITGTPGVAWEIKSGAALRISEWLREAETERAASGADVAPLVVKPKGVGAANTGRWWAVLPLADVAYLLRAAGYGNTLDGAA